MKPETCTRTSGKTITILVPETPEDQAEIDRLAAADAGDTLTVTTQGGSTMTTHANDEVDARLDRVERELRRWRRAAVGNRSGQVYLDEAGRPKFGEAAAYGAGG